MSDSVTDQLNAYILTLPLQARVRAWHMMAVRWL